MGEVRSAPLPLAAWRPVAAPAGLEAFCLREYPRLVAALEMICGDRHVAEDLAQETLVRVWDRWSRVARLESPGGWAYRVALNLARSHLRRRGAEQRAYGRSEHGRSEQVLGADVADEVGLRQALTALKLQQRQAIVLRYYLGHSVAETAHAMDVSEGAVKSLTFRGIATLREHLHGLDVREEQAP